MRIGLKGDNMEASELCHINKLHKVTVTEFYNREDIRNLAAGYLHHC